MAILATLHVTSDRKDNGLLALLSSAHQAHHHHTRKAPDLVHQAAERASRDEGVLGVQAIADIAPGSSDRARLHLWFRAGLNEGCLGARLSTLWNNSELYGQWYDR